MLFLSILFLSRYKTTVPLLNGGWLISVNGILMVSKTSVFGCCLTHPSVVKAHTEIFRSRKILTIGLSNLYIIKVCPQCISECCCSIFVLKLKQSTLIDIKISGLTKLAGGLGNFKLCAEWIVIEILPAQLFLY